MASSAKHSASATELVSDFYERYPYPDEPLQDGPPPGCNWRWSLEDVTVFCKGILPSLSQDGPCQILDAGCGTGVSTDYLAHLNPDSEVLAVDISSGALEVAKERLQRSGAMKQAQISLEKLSLFDLSKSKKYDYINSVGVLHHLDDPGDGLKMLKGLLKDQGLLHLSLYAEAGRMEIMRVQKIFSNLGVQNNNKGLELARNFFLNLPENNKIRRDFEAKCLFKSDSDVNFADMYLHPKETSFNLDKLFALVDYAGLEFVGFSNPQVWDIERFLQGDLLARAKKLDHTTQWHLIEQLDPDISHFEFFLSKGRLEIFDWTDDIKLLNLKAKMSRCMRGWPGENLYDSDLNQIKINANELELMSVIEKNPDKLLKFLPLPWDLSLIASTARDLLQKRVLLLYP